MAAAAAAVSCGGASQSRSEGAARSAYHPTLLSPFAFPYRRRRHRAWTTPSLATITRSHGEKQDCHGLLPHGPLPAPSRPPLRPASPGRTSLLGLFSGLHRMLHGLCLTTYCILLTFLGHLSVLYLPVFTVWLICLFLHITNFLKQIAHIKD